MSKRKPKIALFDLDDTLVNLKQTLYDVLVLEYGKDRVPHWALWDAFDVDQKIGISIDELKDVCVSHKVFRLVRPTFFAPFILNDLKSRGFHILIVTSRHGFVPNAIEETKEYLKEHKLVHDELVVTHHGHNKMDSLLHHDKMTFAIDDQVKNCVDFADSGKFDHVFLAALQHNKQCNQFPRLHNLFQIYKYIGLE